MSATEEARTYIGARQRKHNGDLFLTGRARYIADLVLPGQAYAAFVRSPYAHATIRSIDTSRALASPGVLAVVTGEDAERLANPIPHFIDAGVFGGRTVPVRVLALGKVKFAGQPVAVVVAETRNDADRAAALVDATYEPLPIVLDADAALLPDAPLVNDEWEDNVVIRIPFVDGDVDAAIAEADGVLTDEIKLHRYTTAPIETRGYNAHWDAATETLTFHGSCQNPHPLRWMLAQILGLDENRVRVIAPFVGGGFGLKMHGHPEEGACCIMSRLLGRPVKWIESRRESCLIGARESTHRFTVAYLADGTITALRNHFVANVGTIQACPGWGMSFLTALAFPTGYRIPNIDIAVTTVTTNKGPWNAARGYGKEATNTVMERIVQMVGRALGIDPNEVRRKNLIRADEFPFVTATGLNVDSGDYHTGLQMLLDHVDYDGLRAEHERLRAEGRYRGIGIAFEMTPEAADIPATLVGGYDTTCVRMDPTGKVTVLTGVTTPGSGNDTAIAQVVASELGVLLEDITVVQGDTALCPYGFGNYSGRSMVVGGGSAALAARDIREKLGSVAARLLECDPGDIRIDRGVARHVDTPAKSIPVGAVAHTIYTLAFTPLVDPVEPPLESTRVYKPDNIRHTPDEKGRIQPYPTYSNAIHAAVVEVDVETGVTSVLRYAVVHDCGVIVNPQFVEGQMQGASTMGIGAALSEHLQYDEEGRLLNDRFKTYLLPRASDVPSFEMLHQVTPSPYTLLGTKGAGEAGVGGAKAVIANAVDDALAPLGVTVRELPLDPPRVLRMIHEAGGGPVVIAQELEYHGPASADEALALLAGAGDETVIVGGGTWVVPELTYGDRTAARVVDLRRAGLGGVRDDGDAVVIGAMTTYAELLRSTAVDRVPLLRTLAAGITGGAQVRNVGTVGGSACYASPTSDVPAALVALGATLRVASAEGGREVPADAFFAGARRNALAPGELLRELVVPAPAGARYGYVKLKFGQSSWPVATAACVLQLDGDGTLLAAALVLGGVEGRPLTVDLEGLLGSPPTDGAGAQVALRAAEAVTEPYADVLADAGYRRSVAGVLARRAFDQAATGERG